MAMNVGASIGAMSEINMTPMIDILLVLLIIFMVITPMTPHGLEALVPQPPPPGAQQNVNDTRTVVIIINRDKTMLLNAEPMDENRLGARLEEVFKTRNERVVFVKGDPDLEYQVVTRAIDIAKGAGIDKVGLMTPKVESGN